MTATLITRARDVHRNFAPPPAFAGSAEGTSRHRVGGAPSGVSAGGRASGRVSSRGSIIADARRLARSGRIPPQGPMERIASLLPSTTEIVCALEILHPEEFPAKHRGTGWEPYT